MARRPRSWQGLFESALDLRGRARAAVAAGVAELVEPRPPASLPAPAGDDERHTHEAAAVTESAEAHVRKAYEQLRRDHPLTPPARLISELRLLVNQLENSGPPEA